MEILILTGTLAGAFFVSFFMFGFFIGMKYQEKKEKVVKITNEKEAEAMKQMFDWLNYNGGNQ